MRKLLPLLLSLTLLLAASLASAQDQPKLSVLFMHGSVSEQPPGTETVWTITGFAPDETLQNKLAAEGMTLGLSHFSTQLTLDFLQQFNVVVLLDFPMIERHQTVQAAIREKEALLRSYVERGGGLLLMGNTEYGMWGLERDFEEMDRFLAPWDATVLHEQVGENSAALTLASLGAGEMAWTGNVAKHPLTEGVRGLLYPLDFAWVYYTHPLQVGKDWTVLLKASPSAATYSVTLGGAGASGSKAPDKKPGVAPAEPPLLAVREVGKGRVGLWPTIPSPYIIDAYHQFWGSGLTMEGTNAEKPSDGRRLLTNLLSWLGAPSTGAFGGYTPPKAEAGIGDEVGFQEVNWDQVKLEGKSQPNCYRGLLGMRSNLSTGASSPQEMIAAAKAAGYHFAAFTEDLDQLTAAKLASLKQVCADACSETFMVYPGFAYKDESGNSWTAFGKQIDWPKDDWWSKARPGAIVKNNFIFRGFQFMPLIMTDAGHNPEPVWLQGNFKGMAVFTYSGGKLLDDATPQYLKLSQMGFDLFPVVVHAVRSAAEVAAAAAAPQQTYVRWWELSDVISALSLNSAQHQGSYVWHRASFVSSGPLVEDFRVYNFGTADLAVPSNDRYRIHLSASSPKGLQEVALYDGPTLLRRVAVGGVKEWTGDWEGYQDKNRAFLAVLTDTAGGKAISAVRWTNVQEIMMVRCTDNLNTYPSGKFIVSKFHALRGLESYIDRQAGAFSYFPNLYVPETERPAVEQNLTACGRFGYLKDDVVNYYYPTTASANWNANDQPELAAPAVAIKGRTRTTLFTPRADGTSVYLVEGDYTSLRDQDLARPYLPAFGGQWTTGSETVYVARPNAPAYVARMEPRKSSYGGSLDEVEYVANLAALGGARAIIPLSKGLDWSAMLGGDARCYLGANLAMPGKKLTKDQPLHWSYLAVWGPVNGTPDSSFIEDVYAKLGLRGAPAYQVKPEIGKVLDTRFALRLQAQDGGFAGTITKANLPLNLPVFIAGLNPRWPAGILYLGKNTLQVPFWRFSKTGDRYIEYVTVPGENQLQRFPITDGVGMLQVDTESGDRRVFIGNLLTCDDPEVFLSLDDARPGKQAVSANNPTDKPVTVTLKPAPGFPLLGDWRHTVTLKPGEEVKIKL